MKKIDIFKITTPVCGTTDIEIVNFIKELLQRLRQAKSDSNHYGWKCTRYTLTMDKENQLWLSGWTNNPDVEEN